MTIRSGIGLPVLDIGTSDTTVLDITVDARKLLTAFSIHNTTATAIEVTLWESPNTTSASGDQIAVYSIAGNTSIDVQEIIGQGYDDSRYIIAQGDAAGCNRVVTFTEYTDED